MRNDFPVFLVLVLAALVMLSACSSDDDDPPYIPPVVVVEDNAPIFMGLRDASTAGGAWVRLSWDAAQDDWTPQAAIRYLVYVASTSGGQNFAAPTVTTAPGVTQIVISAGITVDQDAFIVVRAVDGAGNIDDNEVEVTVHPMATGSIAFVSDTAGGTGTLGNPADPYPTIQTGVAAVEGNGEGLVLVDSAAGGTVYNEEVDLTTAVTHIGIYGGFDRFSNLPASPTGEQILNSRDLTGHPTTLSGTGLAPFANGDLVRVANTGSPTVIDGIRFRDTYQVTTLTGTVAVVRGANQFTGTGTLFTTELAQYDFIRFDADNVLYPVSNIGSDTNLNISGPYLEAGGSGAGTGYSSPEPAIQGVNAVLQVSGCDFSLGAFIKSDTVAITNTSALRFIGNTFTGRQFTAMEIGGGIALARIQNNRTWRVQNAVVSATSTSTSVNVPTTGCVFHIADNYFDDNRMGGPITSNFVEIDFAPADTLNGGVLNLVVSGNEVRKHNSTAFRFNDCLDLGANGSFTCVARDNLCTGSSNESIYIGGLDTVMYAGVSGDIDIFNNAFPGSNGNPVEVDITVAANQTSSVKIHDNFFFVAESEIIEVDDEEDIATLGVHDQGVIILDVYRNLEFGGAEDCEVDIGTTHGGRTIMRCWENTIHGTEDPGLSFEGRDYIGDTGTSYTAPDGLLVVAIFNNDCDGEEVMEVDDRRGTATNDTSLGIYYIGHNIARSSADGSDGAIECEADSKYSLFLAERNFTGGGGEDTSEAGMELEGSSSATGWARVFNSVAAFASGGGFKIDADGIQWELVNCTAAYTAQTYDKYGFEGDDSLTRGENQAYILNSIASHNANDVDEDEGLRPIYTFVRDGESAGGLGNLGGEPFYDNGIESLLGLGKGNDHENLREIFNLLPTSPAKNAGHPDPRFNNPNGSRNDMGAYGGPNAGPIGFLQEDAQMPLVFMGTYPGVHLGSGEVFLVNNAPLILAFNQPIDSTSAAAGIAVTNGATAVSGAFTTDTSGYFVRFTPSGNYSAGTDPFVTVWIDAGLRSTAGPALAYPVEFTFAVAVGAPLTEAEPNDDSVAGLSAADFTAAQSTGIAGGMGAFRLTATVASATDIDVYSFQAAAGQRITSTILDARAVGGADGAIHLDLYDANGVRITEGWRDAFNADPFPANGDTYLSHTFATAGTCYLVVFNPNTAAPPQNYVLYGVLKD